LLELERSRATESLKSGRVTTSMAPPEFACPACRITLARQADGYACPACARVFAVVDGIPLLVLDAAGAGHGELDHHRQDGAGRAGDGHKTAQARFTDEATREEFEIDRPHGTPRLYRFLLQDKLRRATAPIGDELRDATALVVCGGSGMDGEFLARAGAHVVSSDLSLGAARRTRERGRRYGIDILPVVADVEALPFGDRAFDLVLVHDGLHHLERPDVGLAEMTRVADRWVSVTEPARAVATTVAVKLGLAVDREPAGNRVERMSPLAVAAALAEAGFRPMVIERYAMYYHHTPGRLTSILSAPGIYAIARFVWLLGNAVVGRVGNKMVAVAERGTDGLERQPHTGVRGRTTNVTSLEKSS
jgi:SAM-dependent methyltransferase